MPCTLSCVSGHWSLCRTSPAPERSDQSCRCSAPGHMSYRTYLIPFSRIPLVWEDDVGVDIPIAVGSTGKGIVHRGPLTACPSGLWPPSGATTPASPRTCSQRPVTRFDRVAHPFSLGADCIGPERALSRTPGWIETLRAAPVLLQSRSRRGVQVFRASASAQLALSTEP